MSTQNEILKLEINKLHEAGHRFKNKEISAGDFKGISGGMGVYAQRGGQDFMIRFQYKFWFDVNGTFRTYKKFY